MALEDVGLVPARPKNAGVALSVAEVERRIGAALPPRLARLLERFEGPVYPDPCRIEGVGRVPRSMARFLRSRVVEPSVLLGRNDGAMGLAPTHERYAGRLRPGLIPFAGSYTAGDLFLCEFGQAERARVYFWWHESPSAEDSDESLLLVAESFEDFCDRLTPFDRPD